jgi:putative transposase
VTRYRWVAARRPRAFPITMAAQVAGVSRQAFGDWRARQAAGLSDAERAEVALVAEIREIHDEFDGTYGEPRITTELARRGRTVNHKRVERLMRAHEIVGVHKPARVRTTIPAEDSLPLPDLIGRRFDPGAPDVAWVGDITYVPTDQGWLYLASVLDLGSRRLLGYSMADHMRTELVADALTMAAGARGGATAGIIFHGDRGSQYLAGDYRQQIAELGMVQSVGRTGVCWDNSVAESLC